MNKEWEQFLLDEGAKLENNCVVDFGHSISEEQAAFSSLVITDLSQYGLISASGADVVEFLQGQLTNDFKVITDNEGQLSAYCNPKGRILANFRIFKRENHYFLRLHKDILDATLKRLRMFVMRSKVELLDRSDEIIGIGIAGNNARAKLSTIFKLIPDKPDAFINENDITLIQLPGNLPQFEAYGPVAKIKAFWEALKPEAIRTGVNSWNLLTIRAGIPEVAKETVEEFVPQMVNLQAINSLSFTKGCYPGQEVVARMHYLGKIKRRLYLASAETSALPQPGQAVLTSNEDEEKAGQIVSASWSGEGKAEFLAVLQIAKATQGGLHLDTTTGPEITLGELPYNLEKS